MEMKRLVIDGVIFGLQKAGGISRMWAEALLGLDKGFAIQNKVFILMPKNKNVEWERIQSRIKNISIIRRKKFNWEKKGYLRDSAYLSMMAALLRADLWHSSYYVGVPYFNDCHKIAILYDMIPEHLGCFSSYETRMKYHTLRKSQSVISISHHSLKDLGKFWPEIAKKTQVVHLCRPEKNEGEEIEDLVSFPYFIFVGKRKGYKNFTSVLEGILKIPKFDGYHIIAAGGEASWNADEQKIIRKYQAEDRVHCEGILPYDEIQRLISLSSALLYPSKYEGFGLPILEAFEYGVPVLACRTSSIPEITGSDYPLADPDDPHTFAAVLSELLDQRSYWVDYAKNRLQFFQKKSMIDAWTNIYTQSHQ